MIYHKFYPLYCLFATVTSEIQRENVPSWNQARDHRGKNLPRSHNAMQEDEGLSRRRTFHIVDVSEFSFKAFPFQHFLILPVGQPCFLFCRLLNSTLSPSTPSPTPTDNRRNPGWMRVEVGEQGFLLSTYPRTNDLNLPLPIYFFLEQ